jgi:hypothetical protein
MTPMAEGKIFVGCRDHVVIEGTVFVPTALIAQARKAEAVKFGSKGVVICGEISPEWVAVD